MRKLVAKKWMAAGAAGVSLLLAGAAHAGLVQYTGTMGNGYGQLPDTVTNRGLPGCNSTAPATTAVINFVGFANVLTGPAPQAVQFSPHPTAGVHTLCNIVHTINPSYLTHRTNRTEFQWPGTTGTFAAGSGIGATTYFPPFAAGTAGIAVVPGTPQYGGSLKIAGDWHFLLGLITAASQTWSGGINFQWSLGQRGSTQPATTLSRTTPWIRNGGTTVQTMFLKQVFMPWTTGQIIAFDSGGGQGTTVRTRTGFDNRNTAGTSGVLQLVTPSIANAQGLIPLAATTTSTLTLNFVPEPSGQMMLASGGVMMLGFLMVHRRRKTSLSG